MDFEEAKSRTLSFFKEDRHSLRNSMDPVPSSKIHRYMERYRKKASVARALVALEKEGKLRRIVGYKQGQTALWQITELGLQCLNCPHRMIC